VFLGRFFIADIHVSSNIADLHNGYSGLASVAARYYIQEDGPLTSTLRCVRPHPVPPTEGATAVNPSKRTLQGKSYGLSTPSCKVSCEDYTRYSSCAVYSSCIIAVWTQLLIFYHRIYCFTLNVIY
jgi:hypothetical protein